MRTCENVLTVPLPRLITLSGISSVSSSRLLQIGLKLIDGTRLKVGLGYRDAELELKGVRVGLEDARLEPRRTRLEHRSTRLELKGVGLGLAGVGLDLGGTGLELASGVGSSLGIQDISFPCLAIPSHRCHAVEIL
jgi:hypothetical protein